MRRAIALLFVLAATSQSEWRKSEPDLNLPHWADPAPRDVPDTLILVELPLQGWSVPETQFSDLTLAAILSRTL